MGKNKNFSNQERVTRKLGGRVSEYFDTLVFLFLDRVNSESPEFNWNGGYIRCADKICDERIWIYVSNDHLTVDRGSDNAYANVGVAVARKSIGT